MGRRVSGATALLDASASSAVGIASVTFEVSGGRLSDQVIATGTPTLYGCLAQWNTTAVPNGTYTLQSVATDTVAETTTSAPVSVTVDNAPPTTGAHSVERGHPIGDGRALGRQRLTQRHRRDLRTHRGDAHQPGHRHGHAHPLRLVAEWNTTSVPNGTTSSAAVAAYAGGVSALSPPITIKVSN